MTTHENEEHRGDETRWLNGWRIAGWGSALALLALPAIGTMLTREVNWSPGDFVAASFLLLALGSGIELAMHFGRANMHRIALALSALIAFLTVWANGAVGIIRSEAEPVNLAFYAMVAAGIFAAILVRGRPRAMGIVTAMLAAGQLATGLLAALLDIPDWGPPVFMAVLWSVASLLFFKSRTD